jgi:hypothetical protein
MYPQIIKHPALRYIAQAIQTISRSASNTAIPEDPINHLTSRRQENYWVFKDFSG